MVLITARVTCRILTFCLLLFQVVVQSSIHERLRIPQIRGGVAHQTAKSSVAVFSVGDSGLQSDEIFPSWITDISSPSCFLFSDQDEESMFGTVTNLPKNDPELVETLAVLCDALVVFAPNENGLVELLSAIIKGNNRRLTTSLDKGKLIIVSPLANDTSWVQQLVEKDLLVVTPDKFQIFDILTVDAFEETLKDILTDSSTIRNLFPERNNAELFVKLLYEAYTSNRDPSSPSVQEFTLGLVKKQTSSTKSQDSTKGPLSDLDIQAILAKAQSQLTNLESLLERVMLEDEDYQMPLLQFGTLVNEILDEANDKMSGTPTAFRSSVLNHVVVEVNRLYKEQLQLLRNYYGKRFESTLETEKNEQEWAAAAEHMTQGFKAAAGHAVPRQCRDDGELSGVADFDYINVLNGLINDMMEAMEMRKQDDSLGLEEEEEIDLSLRTRVLRSVPKWAKNLAARAVVLGVNYIQGWLAWQGLKRAALERDRNMPKFPLF